MRTKVKLDHCKEIIKMYFTENKNYTHIMEFYNGKYGYADIRKIVKEYEGGNEWKAQIKPH